MNIITSSWTRVLNESRFKGSPDAGLRNTLTASPCSMDTTAISNRSGVPFSRPFV